MSIRAFWSMLRRPAPQGTIRLDTGFFDAEVTASDDASPLDQLLGFAGRDPNWRAFSQAAAVTLGASRVGL